MELAKLASYSVILAVLFCWQCYADDYSWGIRAPKDILLDRKYIKHDGKWFRWTNLKYQFPSEGQVNYNKITHIAIIDEKPEGKGGYATITGGGVGSNYADIEFKSRWNAGFDFILEIYGHPDRQNYNNVY